MDYRKGGYNNPLGLSRCASKWYGLRKWTNRTGTEITFDLMIARPVGFVGLVLGTSIFAVSFPFAVATGSAKNTADKLVAEPYNFTFVRDLGEY